MQSDQLVIFFGKYLRVFLLERRIAVNNRDAVFHF